MIRKKYGEKVFFFASLNSLKKEVGSGSGAEPDPDPLVIGTDPRIRIRTEKSRIPNTGQQ